MSVLKLPIVDERQEVDSSSIGNLSDISLGSELGEEEVAQEEEFKEEW